MNFENLLPGLAGGFPIKAYQLQMLVMSFLKAEQ
jgi:hypothetical protein